MGLFDDPDPEAPAAAVADPPALPRLPPERRAAVVGWLRKRLRIVAAFRREDVGPLAGPVTVEDARRVVEGRRDLAGFDPEFIGEAFRT